jgi:hypothetical protein
VSQQVADCTYTMVQDTYRGFGVVRNGDQQFRVGTLIVNVMRGLQWQQGQSPQ